MMQATSPQLGATGPGPLEGAKGPRWTSGGGRAGTTGLVGETSQLLGGLGLGHKGGTTGPRVHREDKRTETGRVGVGTPHTQLGRKVQGPQRKHKRPGTQGR